MFHVLTPRLTSRASGQNRIRAKIESLIGCSSSCFPMVSPATAEPCPQPYCPTPRRFFASLTLKGGAPWINRISTNCHFFRDHEQAPQGLPIRDMSKARGAGRARRQGIEREAGQERPLPMRI